MIVDEILAKVSEVFKKLAPTEQLNDKESFGDLDLISLTDAEYDEDFFRNIFGESLLQYHYEEPRPFRDTAGSHTYNLLVRLESGKQIQVDFIKAANEGDFERKSIYYSKGHLSSIIGMMARKLNFRYGTEGFFKRYQDSKNQWHSVLITGNLTEGMRILGLDPAAYEKITTLDDIAEFVASSPYFDSSYFQTKNMVRRDREVAKRYASQDYIREQLAEKGQKREIEDEDKLSRSLFPEKHREYLEKAKEIEQRIHTKKAVNGNTIMETLGLDPGPQVGAVLEYLTEHHPDLKKLTPEIIHEISEGPLKEGGTI